ncbi:MAG: hypothetical protein ABIN67_14580 [Ferruginibacter sp.]
MHYKIIAAILLVCPLFISCSQSGKKDMPKPAAAIAAANCVSEFPSIKSLEFTFNVDRDTAHTQRRWKWQPSSNMVTFYDTNDSVTFKRMDTSTAQLKKLNGQFTNDEYWLIFPLHLQWDMGYAFTDNGTAIGPVTEKSYHKYTVQYNNKDGFTPGDMYELYTDDQHIIQEWAFHKTGAKDPTLMVTWENYEDVHGLKIAKEHKSKDGKFRLYFTGVTAQ